MTRKILILDGHPDAGSFNGALADAYADGARNGGHDVRVRRLSALDFDPVLLDGFATTQETEPDLRALRDDIAWCDHFVLVHPLWWGAAPAKLKGLFDRVLWPDFAFKYVKGKAMPQKLLGGRSARAIVTSDSPGWYLHLIDGAGWKKVLKRQILGFCGFAPVRLTSVGPMHGSKPRSRQKWLEQARTQGRAAA